MSLANDIGLTYLASGHTYMVTAWSAGVVCPIRDEIGRACSMMVNRIQDVVKHMASA